MNTIKKAPTLVEAFSTLNSNSIQWNHLIWFFLRDSILKNQSEIELSRFLVASENQTTFWSKVAS